MYDTIYTFKTARFTVTLAVAPEEINPRDCFDMNEDDYRELCEKIDSCNYVWFVARVKIECDGREVGVDYLGGCCYDNVDQFRRDGYFHDMVRNVCRQARRAIANPPKLRAA
jgi:hypothetical protein